MAALPDPSTIDPTSAVHLSTPRWVPTFAEVHAGVDVWTATRAPDGSWELHMRLRRMDGRMFVASAPFNANGPALVQGRKLLRWGLQRLGVGTWTLRPSLHAEGAYHGYVVLCDVPEPAPWLAPRPS